VSANTHHGVFIEDSVYICQCRRSRPRLTKRLTLRTYVYAMMKFASFAWVAAAACLVAVRGQPTTEADERCEQPEVDLRNVARQTTLTDMAQVLKEVKNAVVKPNLEIPPQLNTNPVFLLTRKTELNPLECRGNYVATSHNIKLVHWPLMGGLLHLVQRGGDWAGPQPAQALLAVPNVTSHPTSKIGTKHAALMTNPEHYLKHFGTKTDQSTINKAEEYLTQVLKKGTNFKKVDQLRN